ncbi:hypothetical protein C7413_105109 [Paraburkholderia silvatlantica]|nr:hypothetical protein C7411_104158 [Paraburkholderia silvatlantica]PXW39772.1 hypothetical protein C7413_105109 [Paraburkholderia silvatlantica]
MKTRQVCQASIRSTLTTLCASATLCACATAWADGGTIRFVGALVAPTFDIAMGHSATGASATMERRQDYDGLRGFTTIAFSSEARVAPRANLSVLPANSRVAQGSSVWRQRIRVRFINGAGRRVSPDAAGRYFIGASGGILTLAPRYAAQTADASHATVLMDYR